MSQEVRMITRKPDPITSPNPNVTAASGQLDIGDDSTVAVTIAITLVALTGGTTPSVTFSLVGVDDHGNEYVLQTGATLTAAGVQIFNQGPGLGAPGTLAASVFYLYRLKWVTTGAPATAPIKLSAYGYAGT